MSLIPCFLYRSVLMRAEGGTKEPFKGVTTSNPVTSSSSYYYYYYYYYTAWSLTKKTLLRLWLERTDRRIESEGKE